MIANESLAASTHLSLYEIFIICCHLAVTLYMLYTVTAEINGTSGKLVIFIHTLSRLCGVMFCDLAIRFQVHRVRKFEENWSLHQLFII